MSRPENSGKPENQPPKAEDIDRVRNFKGFFRKLKSVKNPSVDRDDAIMMVDEKGKHYCVPNDPGNRDWQFYQRWIDDGRHTRPSE